jgi:hypothetical protein
MPDSVTTLEVRKDNWSETRVTAEPLPATLGDNEVLFRVDSLALTANNISYAASGDSLGYWGFFPAEQGWGRIPAMGWGEVIASNRPGVEVGERVWGWFPFSTHLKIQAGQVSTALIHDTSPHRAGYAPVYAQFDRACANPLYEPQREDQDSLLRGLFITSWLVEDFLHVNDSFGADGCVITSASSKTSVSLAWCLQRRGALERIGVTSPGNLAFCERLGCYDRLVTYDEVAHLDATQPVALVDMAGSSPVLTALHRHYAENLVHSCRIGATHYEEMGPLGDLPGARPQFFFAPAHVKSRSAELGPARLMKQMGGAYAGFRLFSDSWLEVRYTWGPEAVGRTYLAVLGGRTPADSGQIISMWPNRPA